MSKAATFEGPFVYDAAWHNLEGFTTGDAREDARFAAMLGTGEKASHLVIVEKNAAEKARVVAAICGTAGRTATEGGLTLLVQMLGTSRNLEGQEGLSAFLIARLHEHSERILEKPIADIKLAARGDEREGLARLGFTQGTGLVDVSIMHLAVTDDARSRMKGWGARLPALRPAQATGAAIPAPAASQA